ncbi:hypothetical protein BB561_003014, partial [Smittium simulii]
MPRLPGAIPSAAAGVPYHPAKSTRLEYSTIAKTVLIDPASKNDYHFNFPTQNNQKNQKTTKKFEKNNKKNHMNTTPKLDPKNYIEVSIKHLIDEKSSQKIEFFPKALSSKTLMLIKKRRKLFHKTKNNAELIPLYNELKTNTANAIKNDVKLKYIKELEA